MSETPTPLVAFVYQLLHAAGLDEVERALANARVPLLVMANPHIAAWAQEIADRLLEGEGQ